MEANPRKWRNVLQNMAITLLAVSAVLLFAQTQLYNLGASAGSTYFSRLVGTSNPAADPGTTGLNGLSAPVRLAVTGSFGRYGDLQLTTAAAEFVAPGALLSEALGSAGALSPCGDAKFWEALNHTSVYYDFLAPLPLSVLAKLTGSLYSGNGFARRLLLSETGDGVTLYLWNEDTGWVNCSTAVTREQLSALVADYELGNAGFAHDNTDEDDFFRQLNPYSLFLSEAPEVVFLSASNPLTDINRLLVALDFNPHTNSRWLESDGTEVISEGESSLRIQPNGNVLFQSGPSEALRISSEGGVPTLPMAVTGVEGLLGGLTGTLSGDAMLYLQSIQQTGDTTVLRFDYHVDGIPIRFSSGKAAAEVTLNGNVVTALSLHFRQYLRGEEPSLLLPLRQAIAIAAAQPGELSIGYADNGEAVVSADWLAD